MLKNLKGEMAKNGITAHDIGSVIEKSERTVRDKIGGISFFDFPEAVAIRDKFFPGLRLEYLFYNSQEDQNESA